MRASFLRPSDSSLSGNPKPPGSIYTQPAASVCLRGEGGEGKGGEVPLVVTDSSVQKPHSFHWQQIPSKKPSAVPFSVLVERLNMCYLSQHRDFFFKRTEVSIQMQLFLWRGEERLIELNINSSNNQTYFCHKIVCISNLILIIVQKRKRNFSNFKVIILSTFPADMFSI